MKKLTEKQTKLMRFIYEYRVKHGTAPTLQEMVKELGVSENKSILGIIQALVKKHYIIREKKKSRSMSLTEEGQKLFIEHLLPIEYRQSSTPADQLRQSAEMMRTSVTISSPSSESLEYKENSIKTNGTSVNGDLKIIIETVAGLMINRYFGGTHSLDPSLKQKIDSAIRHLCSDSIMMKNLGWILALSGLIWINIHLHFVENSATGLVYSVAEVMIIRKFFN